VLIDGVPAVLARAKITPPVVRRDLGGLLRGLKIPGWPATPATLLHVRLAVAALALPLATSTAGAENVSGSRRSEVGDAIEIHCEASWTAE
jgi:hypothetical protein